MESRAGFLKRLSRAYFEIMDHATSWFVASRMLGFISSPVTLVLIGLNLTPVQQGYFYTLYNILSFIVFFELGLGGVLIYIIGHHTSGIVWNSRKDISGPPETMRWLSGLFRKIVVWYGAMGIAFLAIVLPVGYYVLSSSKGLPASEYVPPFILTVVMFGICVFLGGFSSLVEGTGCIHRVKRMQFFQGVAGASGVILGLALHFGLWAVAFGQIAAFFVLGGWVLSYREIFRKLVVDRKHSQTVRWSKEVLPLQWRIAVTWLSGYFINMSFVPILFAYRDPIEAGQMGMELKVSGALYLVSVGLVTTKAAKLSGLAVSDRAAFFRMVRHNALAAIGLSFAGAAALAVLLLLLKDWWPSFPQRLLPFWPTMAIMGVSILAAGLSSLQVYARAQKQDPFIWANLTTAACVVVITFYTAINMDASAMAYGYFLVVLLISVPMHLYFLRFVKLLPEPLSTKSE